MKKITLLFSACLAFVFISSAYATSELSYFTIKNNTHATVRIGWGCSVHPNQNHTYDDIGPGLHDRVANINCDPNYLTGIYPNIYSQPNQNLVTDNSQIIITGGPNKVNNRTITVSLTAAGVPYFFIDE